jgi:DNA-binding transcriptional ArsR family regulator
MNEEIGDQMIGRVVERLRALADETRVRLLLRLKRGESNVTALSEELGVAQASVSKHLNVLRQAGLVAVRREGTQAIYAIRDKSVFELCKLVCDGVVRHAQEEHAALGLAEPGPRGAARSGPGGG